MPAEAKLVNLRVGEIELRTEWNDSPTAKLLYEALPLSASGSYWGGEIYFDVPVTTPAEPDATDVVEPGTIAYWPAGPCLCVFWGPTPASVGGECRAASAVTIVGRVLNPEVLPDLRDRDVRVEAVGVGRICLHSSVAPRFPAWRGSPGLLRRDSSRRLFGTGLLPVSRIFRGAWWRH